MCLLRVCCCVCYPNARAFKSNGFFFQVITVESAFMLAFVVVRRLFPSLSKSECHILSSSEFFKRDETRRDETRRDETRRDEARRETSFRKLLSPFSTLTHTPKKLWHHQKTTSSSSTTTFHLLPHLPKRTRLCALAPVVLTKKKDTITTTTGTTKSTIKTTTNHTKNCPKMGLGSATRVQTQTSRGEKPVNDAIYRNHKE